MESVLDIMSWRTDTDADLNKMNDALTQQAEALQEVGRTFTQTVGKDSASTAVSPLIEQAMENCRVGSLGSLHLLAAQAGVLQPRDKPAFIDVTTAFLGECNWQQVAVAPKHRLILATRNLGYYVNNSVVALVYACIFSTIQVGSLCQKYGQVCISDGRVQEALLPLRTAAYNMGSASSSLTPVHPEFLQCCIMARSYSLGARFLDGQPVFGVDPRCTGLTPSHFLRHFYYGGIVYTGAKRWKDALDSFLMLVTAPANALSSLVVEGYKKMILVSLILSGKVLALPKYTSNVVSRQLKKHSSEYELLGTCCQAEDIKGLHAAVVEGSATFKQDGNMGLVKQVVSALTTRKIMQLTHTYITLSLKDISSSVGLEDHDDGEGHILRMVEAGDIRAKIESPAGTVHFLEDRSMSSSSKMTSRLESDLQSTAELTERVRKLEARLLTNPVFVQKMSNDHSLQGSGLGGPPGYATWDDIGMGD